MEWTGLPLRARSGLLYELLKSDPRSPSRLRSPQLREYKPHTSRMSSFDASTPQLKVVKQWVDAHASLDTKKIAAVTSKNYHYEVLPEVIGIPKEAKEKHIKRFRESLGAMAKAEVRIQCRASPSNSQTDIHHPPGHLSRSNRSTRESCHPRSSLYTEP